MLNATDTMNNTSTTQEVTSYIEADEGMSSSSANNCVTSQGDLTLEHWVQMTQFIITLLLVVFGKSNTAIMPKKCI